MTSHGIAVAPAQPPPAIGPAARTRQAAEPGRLTTATLLLASTLTVMAGATIAPALPAIAAQYADVPGIPLLVGQLLTLPAGVIALAFSGDAEGAGTVPCDMEKAATGWMTEQAHDLICAAGSPLARRHPSRCPIHQTRR